MSISCDCSVDCDIYADFYKETYPKAKKEHCCCECGEIIKPGQKYQRVVGSWEGDFSSFATCATCDNIREHYCPNGSIFGGLAEAIQNCLGFDYRKVPKGA